MTQKELAEALDVKPTAISAWEVGRSKPLMDRVTLMAELFGVTTSDIVGDTYTKEDINLIYNQLSEENQQDVYDFAEMKLEKQNQAKVVQLPSKKHVPDPTMVIAAHADGERTDEMRAFEEQVIQDVLSGKYD